MTALVSCLAYFGIYIALWIYSFYLQVRLQRALRLAYPHHPVVFDGVLGINRKLGLLFPYNEQIKELSRTSTILRLYQRRAATITTSWLIMLALSPFFMVLVLLIH